MISWLLGPTVFCVEATQQHKVKVLISVLTEHALLKVKCDWNAGLALHLRHTKADVLTGWFGTLM